MKVKIEREGEIMIAHAAGKLDAMGAPAFLEAISAALVDGPHRVVIDLSEIPFVSSAGLRVIIQTAKQVMGKGKLAVCGLNASVRQVFELAGFDKLMCLCDQLEAAKQRV